MLVIGNTQNMTTFSLGFSKINMEKHLLLIEKLNELHDDLYLHLHGITNCLN